MEINQKDLQVPYKNKKEIQEALEVLAQKLNEDFSSKKEVIFIGVMKGCLPFLTDLAKKIVVDVKFEYVFSKSYEEMDKIFDPKINYQKTLDLKNKDLIIVDDIIETGETIQKIADLLKKQKPSSISLVAMFGKKNRKRSNYREYFLWDEEPKGFLVGYGFDYKEKYRNLNYLVIIKKNN